MTTAPGRRLAAATGLTLAATVALWWLGSTRLEIDRGGDAGRAASDALAALALLRALLLALLGPRLGVLHGARFGAGMTTLMVAPAWPLVVLAWSASTLAALPLVVLELALLVAAVLLPALGQGLQRLLPSREWADLVGTTAGALLAALLWRAWWASWQWPLT